ncbi:5-formyltetrahydrofolate cyclo-ligase [Saccharopolyspora cebuensis]|uniref:5-formyltetrahydrofolate cyclo-ligase n=1 Tax=Saccharopolyspora cebuensis TaxID=418759 RepID=A0ABV4CHM7_9PSEU
MSSLEEPHAAKDEWRRALLRRRAEVPETTRSADAAALRDAALSWADERGTGVVAAYVPVTSEPGSLDLLDALRAAGRRVLLPVVTGARPLDWADYTGPESLAPARFGLLEPTGPRLGAEAVGVAGAVLVPALGIDHRGVRLGRGAGHYDRSLPLTAPGAALIGVVRDPEFVPELPGEPHDVRMTAVLTPGSGVRGLPM